MKPESGRPISVEGKGSLLRPSFYDLFFVVITVWLFIVEPMGWQRLLVDGDSALHLGIGDYILANHQVPTHDPFSFSMGGKVWYAFEWLSEVIFASLNALWGLKGVVLLSGLIISLVLTLLWRFAVWSGANSGIALILVFLSLNAAGTHFHARPHLFTWLFLMIAAWIVARDRRQNHWSVWLLAPLIALWANLHGGFFIFFALLVILAIGTLAEAWLIPEQRPARLQAARRYTLVMLACAGASLINPYGWGLHGHIIEVLRAGWILDMVDEFRSPSFHSEGMKIFAFLLFVGLGIAARLLEKGRIVEALWVAFLAYASLVSVRHVPIYVLFVTPIIAVELSALWASWVIHLPKSSTGRIIDQVIAQRLPDAGARITLWPALFVVYLAVTSSVNWPRDFSPDRFPVALVTKYRDELSVSRVLCTDQWGGYLIYKNPHQKIFFDGRNNYYGEKFSRDSLAMMEGQENWKQLFESYRFDIVLSSADLPLTTLVLTLPGWRVGDRVGNDVMLVKTKT